MRQAAKGDWKQLLQNAWNIYCQATARHEWNIEVFTSALARGIRTTKPLTGDSAPASPKMGPKDTPDEEKNATSSKAKTKAAKTEAGLSKSEKALKKKGAASEAPKKGLKRKGLKAKAPAAEAPKEAGKKPKKKLKKNVQK
ncbi:unnamed protein product [Symbiodinium pilosum]|uniref:Uncharacterized protein n=1 Tax=Symbiodinium pilosum TaxID=2952 RepID=A0A812JHX4_SYMPI|nr:unnamed protein product [Symbiodinium pilosum]